MAKILGRATIKADGLTLDNKRGATLDPGGVQRAAVVGSRKVHGFSEELTAPALELRITQSPDYTLEDIGNIADATIVFAGDDGVTYVISGAFSTTTPKLNEVDGEITAAFSGISCDRVS